MPLQLDAEALATARRRVARVSTGDLTDWADLCLSTLGRSLQDAFLPGEAGTTALDDAVLSVGTLVEIIRELKDRNQREQSDGHLRR